MRYSFAKGVLKTPRPYKSYAVIADEDYRKFIQSEKRALQAKDERARAKAIAKSAEYIGILYKCPRCKRHVLNRADARTVEFYTREK
ncbi:MAG: hypothetical protein AAB353_10415 [Candidatus Hydrogenedentota bacterium]